MVAVFPTARRATLDLPPAGRVYFGEPLPVCARGANTQEKRSDHRTKCFICQEMSETPDALQKRTWLPLITQIDRCVRILALGWLNICDLVTLQRRMFRWQD